MIGTTTWVFAWPPSSLWQQKRRTEPTTFPSDGNCSPRQNLRVNPPVLVAMRERSGGCFLPTALEPARAAARSCDGLLPMVAARGEMSDPE